MNEHENTEKTETKQDNQDPTFDAASETGDESPSIGAVVRERVRKLLNSPKQRGPLTKQESAKDRTRSLALLIGGVVGALLLFIGVFSTPTTQPVREMGSRSAPNLGRSAASNQPTSPGGSATPLLNADVRSDQTNSDQLSPADIRGTSPRVAGSGEIDRASAAEKADVQSPAAPTPQPKSFERNRPPTTGGSDPLATYRLNNGTGVPTYRYGGPSVSGADSESSKSYSYGGSGFVANENPLNAPSLVKSSIVFVRAPGPTEAARKPLQGPGAEIEETTFLLPPGTRLAARLEAAATTAVKTPVIASIEYNYERGGVIIVPAGTTAIGDVQQSSSEGYLSVRFHTLRLPDGREEKIEGAGVGLDHNPLKGTVSGKNTGKRILSRTLSGVGTIAAYVVGAGGAGLSGTITGGTLLRDRVASNIALAGEQELINTGYSQNISVTVPANTRFYVVLQKAAASTTAPSRTAEPAAPSAEIPTVQELRELMDLRREINHMYQESNSPSPGGSKP